MQLPPILPERESRSLKSASIRRIRHSNWGLCFAKIPADRFFESPGLSRPSRRLSLNAKSNRTRGSEAPEAACAGRMCLQHSLGMVGTAVWEQRLCGTGVVRSQQRATGITLRASHSEVLPSLSVVVIGLKLSTKRHYGRVCLCRFLFVEKRA
jgi:hypothetical protein